MTTTQPEMTVVVYYPRALAGNGGVVNALWLWVESLEQAGVTVQVRFDPDLPPLPSRLAELQPQTRPVQHVGRGRWRVPTQSLVRCLPSSSVLLLHSGYVGYNLIAAAYARRRGIPYVVMPHGAYDPQVRSQRSRLRAVWEVAERRMLGGARAVHVFLPVERAHVHGLAPRARITQSPTAFPVPAASWHVESAEDYLLWIGRFDIRHKGLDRLLQAFALLPPEERPQLRLHGRPSKDDADAVRGLVRTLSLDEHVLVGPSVEGDTKRQLLLGARAFVHASRWESYGIGLVEALAHGVPCLTTTDVGLSSLLVQHGAARVVAGGVEGLAKGLRSAAAGELAEFGLPGRQFVATCLSHEEAAKGLLPPLTGGA